jgi:hypothetical protein
MCGKAGSKAGHDLVVVVKGAVAAQSHGVQQLLRLLQILCMRQDTSTSSNARKAHHQHPECMSCTALCTSAVLQRGPPEMLQTCKRTRQL